MNKQLELLSYEPGGNILLEKNRTAVGNDSSFKERKYSERIFTFISQNAKRDGIEVPGPTINT
ncbi:MAG: hypothetical protein WBZ36_20355 [Candidatus Nitrosopolaris sp.]